MSISFKQFSQAYDSAVGDGPAPEFLEEGPIWDKIKSMAKGAKAAVSNAASKATILSDQELEALQDKSTKGDMKSRKALTDYFRAQGDKAKLSDRAAQVKDAAKAHDKSLTNRFNAAKAGVEARERGSSRAYDRETGSARRTPPRWDPATKQWANH